MEKMKRELCHYDDKRYPPVHLPTGSPNLNNCVYSIVNCPQDQICLPTSLSLAHSLLFGTQRSALLGDARVSTLFGLAGAINSKDKLLAGDAEN